MPLAATSKTDLPPPRRPAHFESDPFEYDVTRIVRLVCRQCGYGVCQRRTWCDSCSRWVADINFHRDEDDSPVRWRGRKEREVVRDLRLLADTPHSGDGPRKTR